LRTPADTNAWGGSTSFRNGRVVEVLLRVDAELCSVVSTRAGEVDGWAVGAIRERHGLAGARTPAYLTVW
jgi:hypothetical protein